jgi:hypothetical protein
MGDRIDGPYGPIAHDVNEADARLIASAPDLLAALEREQAANQFLRNAVEPYILRAEAAEGKQADLLAALERFLDSDETVEDHDDLRAAIAATKEGT